MKKILSIVLCVTLLTAILLIDSQASAAEYGDYEYSVADGKATITRYNGTEETVVIPDELGGYPVTTIGNRAFSGSSWTFNIKIPDSVVSIGDRAFSACTALRSIEIPNSVTSIGERVFYDCDSLRRIEIPDSVTSISEGAFRGSFYLESLIVDEKNPNYRSIDNVLFSKDKTELMFCPISKTGAYTIPDGVISIRRGAFYECSWLTSIIIPDGVKHIGEEAFFQCRFSDITIPNSVTSIDDRAFWFCTNLSSIKIPDSVTSIGEEAFSNTRLSSLIVDDKNSNYRSIDNVLFSKDKTELIFCTPGKTGVYTIPDGVLTIGRSAFSPCPGLTGIIIPDGVKHIGDWAFSGRQFDITIPDSVTSIGEAAFYSCGFSSIKIPASVISIGEEAFANCRNLESLIVDERNPNYRSIDNVLFSKDKTKLIVSSPGKTGAYIIPDGVISIGTGAFNQCKMTSITMSESVTSIEDDAFTSCFELAEVYFRGDAPNEFTQSTLWGNNFTIYYLNGRSGWTTPEWNGYETVGLDRFIRIGDLTGTGTIGLTDAQMALRYALNIMELERWQIQAADVNDDGKVTLLDAQMILRAALNITSL